MQQLPLPLRKKKPKAAPANARRKLPRARNAAQRGRNGLYAYQYEFDQNGRRILAGLTHDETMEFESLEAQLPLRAAELRWLELFNKHEHSRN